MSGLIQEVTQQRNAVAITNMAAPANARSAVREAPYTRESIDSSSTRPPQDTGV
jgi:hypothetical protein